MENTQEKTMSVKEGLIEIAGTLSAISVPAEYIEQIGMPLFYSIRNLRTCINSIQEAEEKHEEAETDVQ